MMWGPVTPRQWQIEAVDAVLGAVRSGCRAPLIRATTGAGKSKAAARLAALARGRVLVTCPTQLLVEQLAATLAEQSPGEVGRAYAERWETDRRVVVVCNASLAALLDERPEWSLWIGDEVHRLESDNQRALRERLKAPYRIGFTATPYRADERGLLTWERLVYEFTSAQAVEAGCLVPFSVVRWDGSGTADTDRVCEEWIRDADGPGIVSATSIEDAERFAERIGAKAIHSKLGRRNQRRLLSELESGRLRALVHVSLLCEGADYPWLRWLCLRRPVASAVRLVQEVGRVLRSSPGKTRAIVYDPHNALDEIGLTHPAVLDDALARASATGTTDQWEIPELEGLPVAGLPPPVAVDRISGWTTDLIGALRAAGLAKPPDVRFGDQDAGWRRRRATPQQRAALGRLDWAVRYLPDERYRRAARWVMAQESLRAGTASNLLDALKALADASAEARAARRHYHLLVDVPEVRE